MQQVFALHDFLPPEIRCFFSHHQYLPLPDPADLSLPLQFEHFVQSRQRDFLFGRLCALKALRSLGLGGKHPLQPLPHGPPEWPAGVVGSISHSGYWAIAAATLRRNYDLVGIDIQESVDLAQARRWRPQIMTDHESWILKSHGLSEQAAFVLGFSVKESIYKALAGILAEPTDFHSFTVLSACPLKIRVRFQSVTMGKIEVEAVYRWLGTAVLTAVAVHSSEVRNLHE